MLDAIVIQLPHDGRTKEMMIGTLGEEEKTHLKQLLEQHTHLNLPVLVLEEKKGMHRVGCSLFWEGTHCKNGYAKKFIPHTFLFNDGACLAKAKGDDEVRFYNSSMCTQELQESTYQVDEQAKTIFLN